MVGTLSLVLNLLWQFASLLLHLLQIYASVSLDKYEDSQSPVLLNVLSISAFTHVCLVHILWFCRLRCFSVVSHSVVSLFICPWRRICGNGIGELSALICSCLHPLGKMSSRSSKAHAQTWIHIPGRHIYKEQRLHTSEFYMHLEGGKERRILV